MMNEEVKNVEIETNEEIKEETSKIYRLVEMLDSMYASIENVKNILDEQSKLVEYLNKDESKSFTKLAESIDAQNKNFETQIETLTKRATLLSTVIEAAKDDENVLHIVDTFIDAIGMFEN